MGGNAFGERIKSDAVFPRLPPDVYHTLKDRYWAIVQRYFAHIAVPAEAPQKKDHGDIDFVVALADGHSELDIDQLKIDLGAQHLIYNGVHATNHFAIPLDLELWNHHSEEKLDAHVDHFVQVDINCSTEKEKWERIVFLHSHGDLGMLMGLITRNAGLHLGATGLQMPFAEGLPKFFLTSSVDQITDFMGFDMVAWREGFDTVEDIYKWLTTSRYFDAMRLWEPSNRSKRKEKLRRHMYLEFKTWVAERDFPAVHWTVEEVQAKALQFFKKEEAFQALKESRHITTQVKSEKVTRKTRFNGNVVQSWTGVGHRQVKDIMLGVKKRLNDDWSEMDQMDDEQLRDMVLAVADLQIKDDRAQVK